MDLGTLNDGDAWSLPQVQAHIVARYKPKAEEE